MGKAFFKAEEMIATVVPRLNEFQKSFSTENGLRLLFALSSHSK